MATHGFDRGGQPDGTLGVSIDTFYGDDYVRDRLEVDADTGTWRHYQDYYDRNGCFVRSERAADPQQVSADDAQAVPGT